METIVIWFALAKAPVPQPPPVYVPICLPDHPKCSRQYPPRVATPPRRAHGYIPNGSRR